MPVAKKTTTAATEGKTVGIAPIRIQEGTLHIVGTSSLVINRFSQKTEKQLLDKHMGKSTSGREVKVPIDQFQESLHVLPPIPLRDAGGNIVYALDANRKLIPLKNKLGEIIPGQFQPEWEWDGNVEVIAEDELTAIAKGRFGFRSCGLKASAVRAATDVNLKMTDSQRGFFIPSDMVEIQSLGELAGIGPIMRQDMVRVGMGTPDIRFRGEFPEWRMDIPLEFNTGTFSVDQMLQLFRLGGFGVGIGEWRRGKGGTWGGYKVEGISLGDVREF